MCLFLCFFCFVFYISRIWKVDIGSSDAQYNPSGHSLWLSSPEACPLIRPLFSIWMY